MMAVRIGMVVVATAFTCHASAQSVTYIHTDALGSVVAESDAGGNVTNRFHYGPYGDLLIGGAVDGPGYTGHVGDLSTGLSYMQQRYMDPELGIFISVDPVTAYDNPVTQFNRYRYANGNPYSFTDPDGRTSRSGVRGSQAAQLGRMIRAYWDARGDKEKGEKNFSEAQQRQKENDKIALDLMVDVSRAGPVKDVIEIGGEVVKGGGGVDKATEVAAGDVVSKVVEKALDGKIGAPAANAVGAFAGKAAGDIVEKGTSAAKDSSAKQPVSSGGVNTRDKR